MLATTSPMLSAPAKTPSCCYHTRVSLQIALLILAVLVATPSLTADTHMPSAPPSPSLESLPTDRLTSMLVRTFDSLRRSMGFFNRFHRFVNLDAIIGTRMVADQFTVLLNRHRNLSDQLHQLPHYVYAIENIQKLAEDVSDKSILYVENNDPLYFKKIGQLLLKRFWEIDHKTRDLNMDFVSPVHTTVEELRESLSDICITELLGTRNGATEPCDISTNCWLAMTRSGYIGYSLSHELFYLQIGQQFGCLKVLEEKAMLYNQPTVDKLAEGFCSNMLMESHSFSRKRFPPSTNDLFMEQIILCGMQGYHQFTKPDWLEHILRWQSPNGCYRNRSQEYRSQGQQKRKKREEKLLDNGCLCHRTTVAVAALSQYIRYILETLASRVSQLPALGLTKPVW